MLMKVSNKYKWDNQPEKLNLQTFEEPLNDKFEPIKKREKKLQQKLVSR